MTEQTTAQPAGVPGDDFRGYVGILHELAAYLKVAARLQGPLTPEQQATMGGAVDLILRNSADLATRARDLGALVIIDPEACEICGTIDQPEFRHLTAEHYGTPGRELADSTADAIRRLFELVLATVTAKNRSTAEKLLTDLLDLASDNLDAKARDEITGRVLGRQPYPECCNYHSSGGRNPAFAHHEQVFAAPSPDGQAAT